MLQDNKAPTTRIVEFGPGLQAWFSPVASANGRLAGLDFRLHREMRGTAEHVATQAGFRLPIETIRASARTFAAAAKAPHDRYAVVFADGLEAQLRPVVSSTSGVLAGVDFRLYRISEHTRVLEATAAGFRIPLQALRDVALVLHELADELGVSA